MPERTGLWTIANDFSIFKRLYTYEQSGRYPMGTPHAKERVDNNFPNSRIDDS